MTSSTRSVLDHKIADLRDDILRLGNMVDMAIAGAMDALVNREVALAHRVLASDSAINVLRYEIEEECLTILATQQPAARDLRTIIAVIHIAVELERMGDHAAGIAKLVEMMEGEAPIASLHQLPKMAKRARQMTREGLDAFVARDPILAQTLITHDDKIDKHNRKLFRDTMQEMAEDAYIRRATYLLWVGHNLERIGDRATNIAERVIFMVTGQFVEVDPLATTLGDPGLGGS
jgi:phosphate transport system protein